MAGLKSGGCHSHTVKTSSQKNKQSVRSRPCTPLLSLFFGRSYNQRTLFRRLVASIFREIFLQKVHFSLLNLHQNTNHCLCNPVSVLVGNFPAISSAFSAFFSTSCLATECLFFFLVLHHWVLLPAGGANRIQRQRVQS